MLDLTLRGLLAQVEAGAVVLPAMQRPFVWDETRISRLIDSLLRGFPVGAVMLWGTSSVQRYRRVARDVDTGTDQIYAFEKSTGGTKYLVLDGQQRLTSLFIAFYGTYDSKHLHLDVLSGDPVNKDPADTYYDVRFLTEKEADEYNASQKGKLEFVRLSELGKMLPQRAGLLASKKAADLALSPKDQERLTGTYLRCAGLLSNPNALHVIRIDPEEGDETPLKEILEIFVRINSGGLVLQKSDLLMSLLDIRWNDIQPEIQRIVRDVNEAKPFQFTRDDVLKSLLLMEHSDTRFDKLVGANTVDTLAVQMPKHVENIKRAWKHLSVILLDDCKIHSERFFRGGHNSLLPFVYFIACNPNLTEQNKKLIVFGIYLTLMSGVFASAEARMGTFSRRALRSATVFPLQGLIELIVRHTHVSSLDDLLRRHLDLTLNIAHGGVTLDGNPEELQRDHIFPKSTLAKEGRTPEVANHYANFHFLRAKDNGNKSDRPPNEWFRQPGSNSPYTDSDLKVRLIEWNLLEPGKFDELIKSRSERIRKKAEDLFGVPESTINAMFRKATPFGAVDEILSQL